MRLTFITLLTSCTTVIAQDTIPEKKLPDIVVKAYEQNRRLQDVPAAINYVNRSVLERFSPATIVQAVNTTPGVRMEERSPGSYRFNIRGSSLRSPFGVRNVKLYFNDIPVTDPGGHSYLNQLGYYNFNSMEIIKGPGNSLYGAGTGGVLLVESMSPNEHPGVMAEATAGSYDMYNLYGSISFGGDRSVNRAGFQRQRSNGYRDHSELKRDLHTWSGQFRIGGSNLLKTTFLYGNLFYETPGALTKSEFDANPRSARPPAGIFPGAEKAGASIRQKQFIVGSSYDQKLFSNLSNKSVLYGMFTELRNAAIQNYSNSSEPHLGGRTNFRYVKSAGTDQLSINVGGEWQTGFTTVSIHKNVNGTADSVRSSDEINIRQSLIFSQATWDHPQWTITAGTSLNFLKVGFQRFTPATLGRQERRFGNQLAPRLAVMKKFKQWNLYATVARGFSPPTTSELLPTGGAVNLDLFAEKGVNYDVGIKGILLGKLYFDVNAFMFSLQNTIVQRRTAGGGDFFINAGKTRQRGIESYVSHPVFRATSIEQSLFWISHTWHRFKYREFKQVNNDYSGNKLPGVAPHVISTGFDFIARNGVLGNVTYYFSDRIPVNDANTEYTDAYHIMGLKIGLQKGIRKFRLKLYSGVDNLFDERYSLGNDVNGFGGRYFNAAAGRNYYLSLVMQFVNKKS